MTLDDDFTPWYPPEVKPVRVGVYERDMLHTGNGRFSFWTGKFWGGWGMTPEIAERNKKFCSSMQDQSWRGLKRHPTTRELQPHKEK